jgi:hypothetical protein
VPRVIEGLRSAGVDAKVIVGGHRPDADAVTLLAEGVSSVYTPKDFSLSAIMSDLLAIVETTYIGRIGRRLAYGAAVKPTSGETPDSAPCQPRRFAMTAH